MCEVLERDLIERCKSHFWREDLQTTGRIGAALERGERKCVEED